MLSRDQVNVVPIGLCRQANESSNVWLLFVILFSPIPIDLILGPPCINQFFNDVEPKNIGYSMHIGTELQKKLHISMKPQLFLSL